MTDNGGPTGRHAQAHPAPVPQAAPDDVLGMRPAFKVAGALVLLLVVGTPLVLMWQGRQAAATGKAVAAYSLRARDVERLCRAEMGGDVQQAAQPLWDDTEWVWTGTVRLSAARPSAAFSCVVPDGGRPVLTLR